MAPASHCWMILKAALFVFIPAFVLFHGMNLAAPLSSIIARTIETSW
jgi:hypothetical protein